MTDLQKQLDDLRDRGLGIVASAYTHARKCSGDAGDNDKAEGTFMRMLFRRMAQLHEDYAALMRTRELALQKQQEKKP